ncbi:hypothetical protein ACO0LV_17960 [Pseudactinotalea sp. Z1739]|uniref:hypothetical protein n=1 Tax=Pseudactinotalea sp. Z1739 TaxID=3413028 RepID=UPI003C7ED104
MNGHNRREGDVPIVYFRTPPPTPQHSEEAPSATLEAQRETSRLEAALRNLVLIDESDHGEEAGR